MRRSLRGFATIFSLEPFTVIQSCWADWGSPLVTPGLTTIECEPQTDRKRDRRTERQTGRPGEKWGVRSARALSGGWIRHREEVDDGRRDKSVESGVNLRQETGCFFGRCSVSPTLTFPEGLGPGSERTEEYFPGAERRIWASAASGLWWFRICLRVTGTIKMLKCKSCFCSRRYTTSLLPLPLPVLLLLLRVSRLRHPNTSYLPANEIKMQNQAQNVSMSVENFWFFSFF